MDEWRMACWLAEGSVLLDPGFAYKWGHSKQRSLGRAVSNCETVPAETAVGLTVVSLSGGLRVK